MTAQGPRVAFRSLTEHMDTTTPSGEFLFSVFGALAQYERALTRERVVAGLGAQRTWPEGRPAARDHPRKARCNRRRAGGGAQGICVPYFKVKRTTLIDTLARVGWTGSRGVSSR